MKHKYPQFKLNHKNARCIERYGSIRKTPKLNILEFNDSKAIIQIDKKASTAKEFFSRFEKFPIDIEQRSFSAVLFTRFEFSSSFSISSDTRRQHIRINFHLGKAGVGVCASRTRCCCYGE